jgi:hypothetical protein
VPDGVVEVSSKSKFSRTFNYRKDVPDMPRLAKAIHNRREHTRSRRELSRAIINAPTPALRDELILLAQRDDGRDS